MRIAAVFLVLAALATSAPSVLPNVRPAAAATGEAATESIAGATADTPTDTDRSPTTGPASDAVRVPSGAPPVDDVFRSFDLFGAWAADCGRPASPDNPYVSITLPSAGLVLENNDVGPGYAANRYSVLSARGLSASRLEVAVIFRPGAPGEERQTLIFAVGKGTRRTMYNRVEGGAVRVRNGVVLALGIKTPVLKKCG
jgi:hypothetical protein